MSYAKAIVLLLLAFALQGCLVARRVPGVRAALPSGAIRSVDVPSGALPHGTAVAAGRYLLLRGRTAIAADSFWIYRGEPEGHVLHAVRHGVGDGAEYGITLWLEVDAAFRPVRGWEERVYGTYRCRTSFVHAGEEIVVRLAGGAGRDGTLRLRAPARFGVAFDSPVADGWAAIAAQASPGPLPVLHLGHCLGAHSPASGFMPIEHQAPDTVRRAFAGRDIGTLLIRRGDPDAGAARDLLWVEPTMGIPVRIAAATGEDAVLDWVWALEL